MAEVGNVPGEPASPEELRSQVKAFIDSLVQAALEANKPLGITHLGDLLITRFPGDRVYQRLGFKKLSQLVASLDAYDVHTINDNQYLTFKGQMAPFPLPLPSVETAQPPVESQPPKNRPSEPPEVINELRQAICESLNQILLDCEQKGIKIELPAVSHRLKESFGNEHFKRSGYSKFSSLIRSFPEFTINITDDGHNYLERANPEDCAAITQLRAEVAACMLSQIESAGAEGKMIASSMMLYLVKAAFPDPRIQNCLGFSAPTDFLRSFPEIQVIQETGVDIILPAGAPRPGIPSGQSSSEL